MSPRAIREAGVRGGSKGGEIGKEGMCGDFVMVEIEGPGQKSGTD